MTEDGGNQVVEEQRDLAAELASMEDRWKRALADLDNYRKRSAGEAERRIDERTERLLLDWLEAVDSVERALAMTAGEPDSPVTDGLRSVLEQMDSVLERQGVRRFGAEGEPFDPERHEAVAVRATDDVPDRSILQVARSGYERGDRVLRPAQVVVSQAPQDDG